MKFPIHSSLFAALILPCLFCARAEALEKWLYCQTNLLVDKNIDSLDALWRRGKAAGYSHVLLSDSKFSRLGEMDSHYFNNVARVKKIAAELGLEIVPALFSVGYSNDLLSLDTNLIEAQPVKEVPLIVENGFARMASAPIVLPGGDFSDLKKWSFTDPNVVIDAGSALITDPKGKNARVSQKLKVTPFRQYHVSVRVKTDHFVGTPEIKVLAGSGRQLSWNNLGTKPTEDWKTHHLIFNSGEAEEVTLYFGVWDGKTGSLWWDDAKIEEVAFVNLACRPGTPLVISTAEGKTLVEGVDYEPLDDPLLGKKPYAGEFDVYHEPPRLKTNLPDGTQLLASYYHGVTIYDGQAMICPSEPKTVALLRDQAERMHKLWGAKGYMMSHDEIRVLNQCEACQKRGLTPGQILADNVRTCIGILREVNPGGRIYVWSDMFDPAHNAVKGPYYLVNGSLEGSWEGLDKEVIILPWNFETRTESIGFFAARGQKQVIAGYYDAEPGKIGEWLKTARKFPGSVVGVMYTTWENKYGDIEKFSAATDKAENQKK